MQYKAPESDYLRKRETYHPRQSEHYRWAENAQLPCFAMVTGWIWLMSWLWTRTRLLLIYTADSCVKRSVTTSANLRPTGLAPVALNPTTAADALLLWRAAAAFQIQEDHLLAKHEQVNLCSCVTEHIEKSVASVKTHLRDLYKNIKNSRDPVLGFWQSHLSVCSFLGMISLRDL